ncbi:hypothetical protein PLICRDRAFT_32207 [Plicaturopsis crispa FD-325 SS-3]|uniref:Uncharacterized protein n=1 Tax=Plicaturopsis crispa FD-325 SS-3 TaxID=944288 RepID=A0A0C9SRA2_PLICR|nr:hypothetical protein PLICRDRAFT_32207 [Plicaturopsis crispa FD-325 SS-3]
MPEIFLSGPTTDPTPANAPNTTSLRTPVSTSQSSYPTPVSGSGVHRARYPQDENSTASSTPSRTSLLDSVSPLLPAHFIQPTSPGKRLPGSSKTISKTARKRDWDTRWKPSYKPPVMSQRYRQDPYLPPMLMCANTGRRDESIFQDGRGRWDAESSLWVLCSFDQDSHPAVSHPAALRRLVAIECTTSRASPDPQRKLYTALAFCPVYARDCHYGRSATPRPRISHALEHVDAYFKLIDWQRERRWPLVIVMAATICSRTIAGAVRCSSVKAAP